MKSTMLSFLIVLLVSVQMLQAANPPAAPAPIQPLDSYYLVIEWPNTYCLVNPTPPCQHRPQTFTLHGLWPQGGGQSIVKCKGQDEMTDPILNANQGDLTKLWPNLKELDFERGKGFWRHEWAEHGSCSGKPPADYLRLAFTAMKAHDILQTLSKSGITPGDQKSRMPEAFRQAILQQTNLGTEIDCRTIGTGPTRKQYLYQIYFCLTPQGQFKSCPPRYRCGMKPTYMP